MEKQIIMKLTKAFEEYVREKEIKVEDLPVEEDIKKLERRLKSDEKKLASKKK